MICFKLNQILMHYVTMSGLYNPKEEQPIVA